jgi:hypothetical protein
MAKGSSDHQPFLIARGGPFYHLQRKARLVDATGLNPIVRAVIFVAVAWGVPLALTIATGTALGPLQARPFLLDPGAFARFFLAIGLLVLAETQIENHLREVVRQLFDGQLLAAGARTAAKSAVAKALKRRNSSLAELVCFLLAVLASWFLVTNITSDAPPSWAVAITDTGRSPTVAGWWTVIASNTLFWFLVGRALWRHFIWLLLLQDLSRLQTRLVATHPDGHAGLGFVGKYPNAYVLFTVAMSCVISAAATHQVLHGTFTASAIGTVMGFWLVLIFAYFGIPLTGFMRLLTVLKRQTLLAAAARGTEFQRQSERKTLGENVFANDDTAPDTDIPDPAKFYEAAKKLSPMLVTRATLVPVSAAALLPFVAVGLTQLPLKELTPILKHLLML